eukprot:gene14629-16785_t
MEQLLDDMAYEDDNLGVSGNSADAFLRSLSTSAEIEQYISAEDDRPAIIGFFDLAANKQDFTTFEQLAEKDSEHYRFGYTSSKEVLEEKHYSGCTVLVYPVSRLVDSQYDKTRVRYPFKRISNLASLETFMHQKALPLVGEMTPQNEQLYRNINLPVVTVFARINHADKASEQAFHDLLKRVRAVAVKFKTLKFNVADAKAYLRDMDQKFGFEKVYTQEPISVGLREGSVYYAMPQGKFSEELMGQFVLDFLDGKLEGIEQYEDDSDRTKVTMESEVEAGSEESTKSRRKQKQPKSDADFDRDSQVITLTDLNAKSVLSTRNVDIFVEFYAPWCVHCQQLKPELRSTANAFKNDDGVIVAAMDATSHKVPSGFKVEGYPTIYFVPANNKQNPVLYSGSRQAGDMVEYITQHRTTPVDRGSGLLSALLQEEL